MHRREFLTRAGGGTVAVAGLSGTATADEHEENPTPVDGTTTYDAKVQELRSPLAGVPALEAVGDELRVELDADAVADPPTVEARLDSSFGRAKRRVELERVGADADPDGSRIWNDDEDGEHENVVVARFRVPDVEPTLYDLAVDWGEDGAVGGPTAGEDRQPRAVRVFDEIPDEPRVAVIADPQLGDPRALRNGVEESRDEWSPEPFLTRTDRLAGEPDGRWGATRRAVAEVNALGPDLVLVAGDLTLGQDAPGKYYAEYEDAWEILNGLRAPSFCTIGNHDGYVQSGTDGRALYHRTFGPPSYAVDVGDLRVVAVDTYDWSYLDRKGASFAVSTYGGQVRDPQFEWLAADLEAAAEAGRSILAFGHHNPSWKPDPKTDREERADGTPVAEQTARGSRYAESGQLWTGPAPYRLRRLFDETGVDAFFCGHSHRDRIARTLRGDGAYADVVETPGPRSLRGREEPYHRLEYREGGDDGRVGPPVTIDRIDAGDHLADHLRDVSAGTCYVNVTTTQSSTSQYWGWRAFPFDATTDGFDPAAMRYPMSAGVLDDRAVNEGDWNPDHDEVGLYSYPSYLLSVRRQGSVRAADGKRVTVRNDHPVGLEGRVLVSVNAPDPTVEGVEVVWSRTVGRQSDLLLAYEAPAEGTATIRLDE
jgi:3',5'-cyclic AMP phosphodiesterase CpdA